MNKGQRIGFQAGGRRDLHLAIEADAEYQKKREEGKRRRIESLLALQLSEFQAAGYWKKQALLKKIHQRVNREFSFEHCLFQRRHIWRFQGG